MLPGWTVEDGKLSRAFTFNDFDEAMTFINHLADAARRLNHHPEWTNVYNKVRVTLVTHDVSDRITALDIELARAINKIEI